MTFVFDMGGVLSDIDVPGFMERFRQLMPEKEQCSLDPEVLLAGGGDSFLHDYELGLITTGEALNHFHALCRSDITYEQIRQVWLSELAPVQEGKKALLRRLRQDGHTVVCYPTPMRCIGSISSRCSVMTDIRSMTILTMCSFLSAFIFINRKNRFTTRYAKPYPMMNP